jgi:hypothetical protein
MEALDRLDEAHRQRDLANYLDDLEAKEGQDYGNEESEVDGADDDDDDYLEIESENASEESVSIESKDMRGDNNNNSHHVHVHHSQRYPSYSTGSGKEKFQERERDGESFLPKNDTFEEEEKEEAQEAGHHPNRSSRPKYEEGLRKETAIRVNNTTSSFDAGVPSELQSAAMLRR